MVETFQPRLTTYRMSPSQLPPKHTHLLKTVNNSPSSPYADKNIVSLTIGPAATPFTIHYTILSRSPILASKCPTADSTNRTIITLRDLDDSTAHVFIHYLYTNAYQSLSLPKGDKSPTNYHPYKLSTTTYTAASRYALPGLATFAKQRIISLGEDMPIATILSIARDFAFPGLPEEDKWYIAYLESIVRSAMADEIGALRAPEVVSVLEGGGRVSSVVWGVVMSSFAGKKEKEGGEGVQTPRGEKVEAHLGFDSIEPIVVDMPSHTADVGGERESRGEKDDGPLHEMKDDEEQGVGGQNPTSMGAPTSNAVAMLDPPSSHKRSDSAIVVDAVPTLVQEDASKEETSPVVMPVEGEKTNGVAGKKGKKKKKNSILF